MPLIISQKFFKIYFTILCKHGVMFVTGFKSCENWKFEIKMQWLKK